MSHVSEFGLVNYKTSFHQTYWKTVDIRNKRRSADPITNIASLRKIQDFSHGVTSQKLAEVQKQRTYAPEQHRWIYERLVERDCED